MEPTEKDKADEAAIGGLRNTAESVGRLSSTAAYGAKLGTILKNALDDHPDWIDQTIAIGSNDDERKAAGQAPLRPHRKQ